MPSGFVEYFRPLKMMSDRYNQQSTTLSGVCTEDEPADIGSMTLTFANPASPSVICAIGVRRLAGKASGSIRRIVRSGKQMTAL
ncbi:hypothetical protein RS75_10560 [Rhizobium nepotum 39/7]|uniref:Uncharacterized protein n=1 Tax=Rhizobium nepotum 39/7 TaxID=1368418 RepID=A0ABR5CT85_9HYPH|nr:hypothetical protein RS75_10560 [Rhizobium nepotum 39/7]